MLQRARFDASQSFHIRGTQKSLSCNAMQGLVVVLVCCGNPRIGRPLLRNLDLGGKTMADPVLLLLKLPYHALRVPRLRLKVPSLSLPAAMSVFVLVLASYFLVISGFVYDVIVEPPGIGSRQDPITGAVRPVVFLPGRVNGQYIIEGLSSGFMFVLGGIGIVMLDLATDKTRARSVRLSFVAAGVSCVSIAYIMSILFIRIKIPAYLH